MNIIIFETEHFETAFTVIKLFDLPGNKTEIYTSTNSCVSKRIIFVRKCNHPYWKYCDAR